jgi:NAD(P)-dependent dehydrogenase (short-subunit alcohol dehydrogenase family)
MTKDTMNLQGAVAVVTGADRGLGPSFVSELLRRGAAKVYAMSRVPRATAERGVWASRLDVTDPDSIRAASARARDATFIINNDVLATGARLIDGDLRDIDLEMETNFYGALGVTRAFAPALIAHGGGTILNVHAPPRDGRAPAVGAHAATEAAACAMTEVVRAELAVHRIRVVGLHVGLAEYGPCVAPIVAHALDELAEGTLDIVADPARLAA